MLSSSAPAGPLQPTSTPMKNVVDFAPQLERRRKRPQGRRSGPASPRPRPVSRTAIGSRKPSFDRTQLDIIRDMLAQDASPSAIAGPAGVSRQVIYRVQDDPCD